MRRGPGGKLTDGLAERRQAEELAERRAAQEAERAARDEPAPPGPGYIRTRVGIRPRYGADRPAEQPQRPSEPTENTDDPQAPERGQTTVASHSATRRTRARR
ncbi:hypothetical protein [Mycolicibacterium lacusdiani]|uniref:hypothetical protein n=1 Tax=Mycolicibacterium lacusdiani TaxID=2895283 RepID=UPI001F167C35|nr:hypothetical protein [Mycolicibacterium lacusdiani]